MIRSYTIREDLPLLMLKKDDVILVEDEGEVTKFQVLPPVFAHILEMLADQGHASRNDDACEHGEAASARGRRPRHHLKLLQA